MVSQIHFHVKHFFDSFGSFQEHIYRLSRFALKIFYFQLDLQYKVLSLLCLYDVGKVYVGKAIIWWNTNTVRNWGVFLLLSFILRVIRRITAIVHWNDVGEG